MNIRLIDKYNKAVPRYTSYPAVPHWETSIPAEGTWIENLMASYNEYNELSLYIHLPFCEALCTYCGCNKRITKNHRVEDPYIDAVIKEWNIYLSYFDNPPIIKEIHIGGGTPTFFDADNIARLIQHIKDTSELAEGYEFSFEAHPNSTKFSHLKRLFDLGFRRISVGVQDISPEILTAINREQTMDDVRGVTKWARALGYTGVNYDIIYGLPFQQPMNIYNTVKFIEEMKPDRIAFYSYAHVPWKSAGQRAFTIDDVPTGQTKSELYDLGSYMLEDIGYHQVGMDHFCLESDPLYTSYQQGLMHRNFMGYTPNYTRCSIALGASGISDSWNMYVQNEKTIETYQEIVNEGRLPLIKGHVLSHDEEIMRKVILKLMCQDRLNVDTDPEIQALISPYLENLEELIIDGLVVLTNNKIQVTNVGRFFIRNICAAIDPLFDSQLNEKTFSQAV